MNIVRGGIDFNIEVMYECEISGSHGSEYEV
jgi:hypothetical protein